MKISLHESFCTLFEKISIEVTLLEYHLTQQYSYLSLILFNTKQQAVLLPKWEFSLHIRPGGGQAAESTEPVIIVGWTTADCSTPKKLAARAL